MPSNKGHKDISAPVSGRKTPFFYVAGVPMPIATASELAADEVPGLADKIRAFVALARQRAQGGLTLQEFGELLLALLKVTIAAADSVPVSGAARKQWVLDAVGILFDELADYMIPTIAKPFWILFRSGVRALLLKVADGMIESLLPLIRGA